MGVVGLAIVLFVCMWVIETSGRQELEFYRMRQDWKAWANQ